MQLNDEQIDYRKQKLCEIHHDAVAREYLDELCAQAKLANSGGEVNWREQLAAVVEIYYDGTNNAPEDRAYADGAFHEVMYESRRKLNASPVA